MFENLYDQISYFWSFRWPQTSGEITAVDIERVHHPDRLTFRLALSYKFYVNGDGPYTGEDYWWPQVWEKQRVTASAKNFRLLQQILIRYRPDDPSINKIDRSVWRDL